MSVNRLLDNTYALRIIKQLATDFKDMPAYHLGIIDGHGNVIRKSYQLKSEAERNAYTYLDRVIITVKKAMDKMISRGDITLRQALSPALFLVREAAASGSRSVTGLDARMNDLMEMVINNVTLVEEEILVKKFISEEGAAVGGSGGAAPVGAGGAPTNNTDGASVKEPVVKKTDIAKFRGTVARRRKLNIPEIKP
jgi:hypothetical protein